MTSLWKIGATVSPDNTKPLILRFLSPTTFSQSSLDIYSLQSRLGWVSPMVWDSRGLIDNHEIYRIYWLSINQKIFNHSPFSFSLHQRTSYGIKMLNSFLLVRFFLIAAFKTESTECTWKRTPSLQLNVGGILVVTSLPLHSFKRVRSSQWAIRIAL